MTAGCWWSAAWPGQGPHGRAAATAAEHDHTQRAADLAGVVHGRTDPGLASGSEPMIDDPSAGGVYTFVADGIEHALERARDAAGVKDVTVMGGADTGRQFIEAGLVDELSIHLVPVLFGGGTRMFEHLGDGHVQLENLGSVQTAAATHLRFRVVA
jgi:hypothetical protein